MFAAICGTGDKDIEVPIAVVAPGYVDAIALGINGDLRKSIGPIQRVDGKHDGSGVNHCAGMRKGLAAIPRSREHDVVILAPGCIKRPVRRDRPIESLRRPVVIPRQTGVRINFDRLRPRSAVIGRARQDHLRIS